MTVQLEVALVRLLTRKPVSLFDVSVQERLIYVAEAAVAFSEIGVLGRAGVEALTSLVAVESPALLVATI